MQILPTPGDLVHVRGRRWRIVDLQPYDDCTVVALDGAGARNVGERRLVMSPFDFVDPATRPARLRLVTRRAWRRACRAILAGETQPGDLHAVRDGAIDILSHQLEPAMAIARGLGSRVLLADDVGLGKTIQAGLILTELRARGAADRALILTPAGLREQWAAELAARFRIDAIVAGAREIRERLATLPPGVNPWSAIDVAIASVDYVKRAETLPAVAACRWDVLIVDEAHNVAGESDRHDAVARLASRSTYVLLLSATPHSGDRRSFVSLCGLGAHHDPLLVFRRSRRDVQVGAGRRVRCLLVRPNADERRMHALVNAYSRAVCDELRGQLNDDRAWLALAVINKRALSSARSLALTAERRLEALRVDPLDAFSQLALPWSDLDGESIDGDRPPEPGAEPALSDAERERQFLRDIAAAARAASGHETKLAALERLLRRVGEPAIVFTEYRDTLERVNEQLPDAVLLHGGLTRGERSTALADFVGGRARVLLATDAAGEGLNLHEHCRLVVNLELPWNPMRLEQRIGRVDRIGQARTVHAVHLIAADTGEERVLQRLRARIADAQATIGAADPLGSDEERATAAVVVAGLADLVEPGPEQPEPADSQVVHMAMKSEGDAQASRSRFARRLAQPGDEVARAAIEAGAPWLASARRGRTRALLPASMLVIARLEWEDGFGRVVSSRVVPIAVALRRSAGELDRSTLHQIADAAAVRAAEDLLRVDPDDDAAAARAFAMLRLARERAIAAFSEDERRGPVQAGLFDRRAVQLLDSTRDADREARTETDRRLAVLEQAARLRQRPPRVLLVLVR